MVSTDKQWLNSLQVLRFLAALAVVLFHVGSGLQAQYPGWSNPFAMGFAGVDVFFVLSGFIMAHTVKAERGAFDFSIRRIARIVPLYWALTTALFFVAIIAPSLLNTSGAGYLELLKSLAFIPYLRANGLVQPMLYLGWTLCYEMFFYALYAAAILISTQWKALNAKALVVAMLAAAILAGTISDSGNILLRFYTDPILAEFIFGIVLCEILRRFPQRAWALSLALMVVGAVLLLLLQGQHRAISLGIPSVAVVAAFVVMPDVTSNLMRWLVLMGNASYSLYLVHPYCIQLPLKLLARFERPYLTVAGASAGAIAAGLVAVALYRFLERPSQKLLLRKLLPVREAETSPSVAGSRT